MIPIRHGSCEKIAFYVPAIPIGRRIEAFDAVDEQRAPLTLTDVVTCRHCKLPVNLDVVNHYYGLE